jgi:hypothetical protein
MMSPPNSPTTLEQAMQEIAALRTRLAEAERIRDSLLPPLPPELQYLETDLSQLLANSVPFVVALAEIEADGWGRHNMTQV